jgi:hypothetical protein
MSRSLDLNFIARNPLSYKSISHLGVFAVVIWLAVTAYGMQYLQRIQHTLVVAQAQYASLKPNAIVPVKKPSQAISVSEQDMQLAKQVIAQLSAPWNPLLDGLEQTYSKDIALVSIEPNRKKQQVLLTGQARNMEATLAYIRTLSQISHFPQVYLLKHTVDQDHPNSPIQFSIIARWES